MKKLVIVESPNKCATIEKYLGKDYQVLSCVGHFRDLDKKSQKFGKYGFDPKTLDISWAVTKNKKLIKTLKEAIEKAPHTYIATDPDREGEAIGWHIKNYFNLKEDKYSRIIFNAVRKENIEKAIANPVKLNENLYNAYLMRRLVDRMLGWDLSTFIQEKLKLKKYVDTAGRVQSVALWFVSEREKEIKAFKAQIYYTIDATINLENKQYVLRYPSSNPAKLAMQKDVAEEFVAIMPKELEVTKVQTSNKQAKPLLGFSTASLYRATYNQYGMSPKQVLANAQELFQKGYISYHRSDSIRIDKQLQNKIASFIENKFGKEHLGKYAGSNSKGTQDAHEAITALDLELTPEQLSQKESSKYLINVYRAIYNRTIACMMKPPVFKKTKATLTGATLDFILKGSQIVYEGFLMVTKQDPKDIILPGIKKGDKIKVDKIEAVKCETKPPARYNAASLIKKLEVEKIGRPSTYSSMVEAVTANKKHYTELVDKKIKATSKGIEVASTLQANFEDIISPHYTSKLEKSLDGISEQKVVYKNWWDKFYENFLKTLKNANENQKTKDYEKLEEKCPKCQHNLVLKPSRNAKRLIVCGDENKCNYYKAEWEKSDKVCPKCNIQMKIIKSKRGEFLGCQNYPQCKETLRIDGFVPSQTGFFCNENKCLGRIMNQKNKKNGELFETCEFWFKHKKAKKQTKYDK